MRVEQFTSMGCTVVVSGADNPTLAAIRRLFDERDVTFSRFLPHSELSRVNARSGRVIAVSPIFGRMVERALAAVAQTRGLVDPTLGAALEAAGYDRDFAQITATGTAAAPGPAGTPASVRLGDSLLWVPAGVQLDLNGVVKAATVDDAVSLIGAEGFVCAGGDMAVRGPVDVALPGGDAVRVASGGLATSGSLRRRWRRGATLQHHLIDPRTGAPSRSIWEQVTVSGATCLDADIAAKAGFLLSEEGPAWLDELGLPGRFVTAGGRVKANEAWRGSLAQPVCT